MEREGGERERESERLGALRINVLTDMNSAEFKDLRDDLVPEDVPRWTSL